MWFGRDERSTSEYSMNTLKKSRRILEAKIQEVLFAQAAAPSIRDRAAEVTDRATDTKLLAGIQAIITLSRAGGTPSYVSRTDQRRAHKGFDMKEKGFFKAFLKATHSDFAAKLENEVKEDPTDLGCEVKLPDDQIFVPNDHALQSYATHYFEKYQIHIGLVPMQQLTDTIKQLNHAITRPTYLGIISSPFLDQPTTHVVPLLFYFPGNQMMKEIGCLILDGLKNDKLFNFREALIATGLEENNIPKTIQG